MGLVSTKQGGGESVLSWETWGQENKAETKINLLEPGSVQIDCHSRDCLLESNVRPSRSTSCPEIMPKARCGLLETSFRGSYLDLP